MAEKETLEVQYADRIKDLADRLAPMTEVLAEMKEYHAELGKDQSERKERWGDLLTSVGDVKKLKVDFDALQDNLATSKIDIGGDQLSDKETRQKLNEWVHAILKAGPNFRGDTSYLDEVKKTLTTGTSGSGAELVPQGFLPQLVHAAEGEAIIRNPSIGATVVTMDTNVVKIPSFGSVAVNWESEDAASTDLVTTGKTSAVTLTANTVRATIALSNETVQDANPDIAGALVDIFARRIFREEEKQALVGTGSPFNGVTTTTNVLEFVLGDAGDVTFDKVDFTDITAVLGKLHSGALAGAHWVLHRTLLEKIRNIRDSTGNVIWAGPGQNQPATIYGIPYLLSEEMQASPGAANQFALILGNLKHIWIGDRRQMEVALSEHADFRKYSTVMRVAERVGIAVAIPEYFVRMKLAAI